MGNEISKKSRKSQDFEITEEIESTIQSTLTEVSNEIEAEKSVILKTEPPNIYDKAINNSDEDGTENNTSGKIDDSKTENVADGEEGNHGNQTDNTEEVETNINTNDTPATDTSQTDGNVAPTIEQDSKNTSNDEVSQNVDSSNAKVSDETDIKKKSKIKEQKKSKKEKGSKKEKEPKKKEKVSKKVKEVNKKASLKEGKLAANMVINDNYANINYVPCQEIQEVDGNGSNDNKTEETSKQIDGNDTSQDSSEVAKDEDPQLIPAVRESVNNDKQENGNVEENSLLETQNVNGKIEKQVCKEDEMFKTEVTEVKNPVLGEQDRLTISFVSPNDDKQYEKNGENSPETQDLNTQDNGSKTQDLNTQVINESNPEILTSLPENTTAKINEKNYLQEAFEIIEDAKMYLQSSDTKEVSINDGNKADITTKDKSQVFLQTVRMEDATTASSGSLNDEENIQKKTLNNEIEQSVQETNESSQTMTMFSSVEVNNLVNNNNNNESGVINVTVISTQSSVADDSNNINIPQTIDISVLSVVCTEDLTETKNTQVVPEIETNACEIHKYGNAEDETKENESDNFRSTQNENINQISSETTGNSTNKNVTTDEIKNDMLEVSPKDVKIKDKKKSKKDQKKKQESKKNQESTKDKKKIEKLTESEKYQEDTARSETFEKNQKENHEEKNSKNKKEKSQSKTKKSKDKCKPDNETVQNSVAEDSEKKQKKPLTNSSVNSDGEKKMKKKQKQKDKKGKTPKAKENEEEVPSPSKSIFDDVPVEIEVNDADEVSLSSLSADEKDVENAKPDIKVDLDITSAVNQPSTSSNPNCLNVTPTDGSKSRPHSDEYVTLHAVNKNENEPVTDKSSDIILSDIRDTPTSTINADPSENKSEENNDTSEITSADISPSPKSEAEDTSKIIPKKKSKKDSKKRESGSKLFLFRHKSDAADINNISTQEISFEQDPSCESKKERRRSFSEFLRPVFGNLFSKGSSSKRKSNIEDSNANDEISTTDPEAIVNGNE